MCSNSHTLTEKSDCDALECLSEKQVALGAPHPPTPENKAPNPQNAQRQILTEKLSAPNKK